MHPLKILCALAALALLAADPPADAPQKVDADGVPNLIRLSDRIYQGGMPQGDAGFAALEKLGVKTVISVDGARPDLEDAHAHGIRYVHLPMGYDGMTREQALKVAKAVRDLPGPVYVHCHRGTLRGPTAAAVARLFLDDRCTVDQALEGMKLAGFDPRYAGLWAAPKELKRPTAKELDDLPADFPEAAPPPGLTALMVQVNSDLRERAGRAQGGVENSERQAGPRPAARGAPAGGAFQGAATVAEDGGPAGGIPRPVGGRRGLAQALEDALRVPKDRPVDPSAAEEAYKRMDAACAKCHAAYRDVPAKN